MLYTHSQPHISAHEAASLHANLLSTNQYQSPLPQPKSSANCTRACVCDCTRGPLHKRFGATLPPNPHSTSTQTKFRQTHNPTRSASGVRGVRQTIKINHFRSRNHNMLSSSVRQCRLLSSAVHSPARMHNITINRALAPRSCLLADGRGEPDCTYHVRGGVSRTRSEII